MAKLDYQINPVLMEGTVTKTAADDVVLNLRGRLGVIHAAPSLFLHQPREGRKFRFYFSYMQIVKDPLDYDYAPLKKTGTSHRSWPAASSARSMIRPSKPTASAAWPPLPYRGAGSLPMWPWKRAVY